MTNNIGKIISDAEWTNTSVMARVISFRKMGNIAFATIQDAFGRIQIVLKKDVTPDYKNICSSIRSGVHIFVSGDRFITTAGELSILASYIKIEQSQSSGLPDKIDGVSNPETIGRKRYVATATDLEHAKIFLTRFKIINQIRNFLINKYDFVEFETPILGNSSSGAAARPFLTHSNSYDKDFFLRIAPELYLKTIVAGGFPRVFEIGKNFRNEGISKSHMNEFTALEWYMAGANYDDNKMIFVELLNSVLESIGILDGIVSYDNIKLSFKNIPSVSYHSLFERYNLPSPSTLDASEADSLFKRVIRPNLIQPIFVQDYPAHMSPLAKRKDSDSSIVEQWQLIVNGWEIVKTYSELVDPILQRELLEDQMSQRESGNDEAMMIDDGFLESMSFGMPVMAGTGIGIDRLVAILTNSRTIREVTFFPMMG